MSRDPVQQVVRAALRSAAIAALVACALVAASPASAALIEPFRGHLGVGFAKLFASDAPGGSLSAEGGLDYPLTSRLRIGASLGYHLLGGRTEERGSLIASLDYSALTTAVQLHWTPEGLGPVARVSVGPALFNGHVELSTAGGGAMFSDLALSETALGLALDATVMKATESPVRVGFELGTRFGFFSDDTWTLATARLVFHY